MRGKTGCLMHQLEIMVCGEQLFATASTRYAIPSPARAACSSLTGDAAGHGSDALLAARFARLKTNGVDRLLRYVVLPEVLALRSTSMMELASASMRPWSLLVLTQGIAKPGSHSARDCTSNDLTAVDLEMRGLMGASARSVRLAATPSVR